MIRGICGSARELPPRRHWLRITGDRNVARLRVGRLMRHHVGSNTGCNDQERPRVSRVRHGGDVASALRLGSSSVLRSISGGLPCALLREGHLPSIDVCIVNMQSMRDKRGTHDFPLFQSKRAGPIRGRTGRSPGPLTMTAPERTPPPQPRIAPGNRVPATIAGPPCDRGSRQCRIRVLLTMF